MKIIIGIDDTDNRYSRGTGHRARELGRLLSQQGLVEISNITRHQLLVDKRIPFTSHNSAASLVGDMISDLESVILFCSRYLKKKSAFFSDAGLCISDYSETGEEIMNWGARAKKEILTKEEAHRLADQHHIFLTGLTGKKIGLIGALAAVGLRKAGNDGRLLWMKNLRVISGIFTVNELYNLLEIDKIADLNGVAIEPLAKVFVSDWCRPVHKNYEITLFVEEEKNNEQYEWRIASKEFIKSISE